MVPRSHESLLLLAGNSSPNDVLKKLALDGMESLVHAIETGEIVIADDKPQIIAAIRERMALHVH